MNKPLESLLTPELRAIRPDLHQRAIPALAKDPVSVAQIRDLLARVETSHKVIWATLEKYGRPHRPFILW